MDRRWQAIIAVGKFVESEPEVVWRFAGRWGSHPNRDLRTALATCILEHLLEHHFDLVFPGVGRLVLINAAVRRYASALREIRTVDATGKRHKT